MAERALKFSANLGFLWRDRSLPDAIRAAGKAGFAAVECHYPYESPAAEVLAALNETGLPMLGINTQPGDIEAGDFGLAALPDRRREARTAIDEAFEYAHAIGAGAVHVMAGFAQGRDAQETFLENLQYACATANGVTVLIEPINACDVPGYFLQTVDQAAEIITRLHEPGLKLMFDCYHVATMQGNVVALLRKYMSILGHIQFASVPDRGPPDGGELDYREVFDAIRQLGWRKPLGAEYKPWGPTEASLGWMDDLC